MAILDSRAATRRLLDRFGFGPRQGDLDVAVARGFDATVNALLDPASAVADPGARATPEPDLGPEPLSSGKVNAAARK